MFRLMTLTTAFCLLLTSSTFAQKVKPNINESKEYANVIHSPSADSTPKVFYSVLQLEVIVKKGEAEPTVQYANGTTISKDGLMVSVLAAPGTADAMAVESATVMMLNGQSANAELVAWRPDYGVAIFRAKGLEARPLQLTQATLVSGRRVSWHTAYKNGQRTILYTRPLQVHKAKYQMGKVDDLCRIIDYGTSALTAERSGSALLSADGTLLGVMGYHPHWNVTPKNQSPRLKRAWAVPAHVISRLLEEAKNETAAN